MLKRWRADVHIHTALSPCADPELTPPAIVNAARQMGLELIAICDHNTAGNVAAVQRAAPPDLTVLAGIEITTAEEVHVLGIFPACACAQQVAQVVQASLPDLNQTPDPLGEQLLLDQEGRIIGHEKKMLSSACALNLTLAVALIKRAHGLAVAAHVDRKAFSVIGQLGFFPMDAGFDAVEVSAAGVAAHRVERFQFPGLAVITSSDSHILSEIGVGWTSLAMASPCFDEFALALHSAQGRNCGDA